MHATFLRRDKTGRVQTCSLDVSHFSRTNRTSCFWTWAFVLLGQLQSAWSNVPLVPSNCCLSLLGEEVFERRCTSQIFSKFAIQHWTALDYVTEMADMTDVSDVSDSQAHSERIPVSAHCHAEAGVDVSPHGATQTPDMGHCGKISYKVVHFPEKRSSYRNSSKLRTLIWPKAKDSLSISVLTQQKSPTVNLNEVVWSIIPWSQSKRTEKARSCHVEIVFSSSWRTPPFNFPSLKIEAFVLRH